MPIFGDDPILRLQIDVWEWVRRINAHARKLPQRKLGEQRTTTCGAGSVKISGSGGFGGGGPNH